MINRDTLLCISLAGRPGNFGTRFHNYLYDKLGLNYLYKAFTTKDIEAAVKGVRALGIRGCAVSMPFKESCIPFLDAIDPSAKVIDSVNTIVNDDGKLTGLNTDYIAVKSLIASHRLDTNARVMIQGSGGMGKAVIAAFRDAGFRDVIIAARNRQRGLALAKQYGFQWQPLPEGIAAEILATPAPVHALPGFDEGWVTVQDASAQGCMRYLQPKNGERILDLCAAPGGKTTHILEVAPQSQVMAVDIDEQRLSRVYDNLKRLGMKAEVKQGDGRFPEQWCGNEQFDRILLDAPCSATGVIRRHPDIKWLRRDRDIAELAQLQAEILNATWAHLKPGGTLVYATCSILPEENGQQIAAFLARTPDAELHATGTPASPGQQNLPGVEEGDGFFYAKLIKRRN